MMIDPMRMIRQGKKYIPSQEIANRIISYFVFNNFQDFNTWQQVAKTKADYEFTENVKGLHECRIVLKWDNTLMPIISESSVDRNKRRAKKKALKKLIETIIFEGYIAEGFKDDKFYEKLPKRRKNSSDSSGEEQNNEGGRRTQMMLEETSEMVYAERVRDFIIPQILQDWHVALRYSDPLDEAKTVLRTAVGEFDAPTLEMKSSDYALQEAVYDVQTDADLGNEFMDFIQSQEFEWMAKAEPIPAASSPNTRLVGLSSEKLLAAAATQRQQLFLKHFRPLEPLPTHIIFCKPASEVSIPRFEDGTLTLSYPYVDALFDSLVYYHQCPIPNLFALLNAAIPHIRLTNRSGTHVLRDESQAYYVQHRHLLTAEFISFARMEAYAANQVTLQGFITEMNTVTSYTHEYFFQTLEDEQSLKLKINRRLEASDFEQPAEISVGDYVLLISKLNPNHQFMGLIKSVNPIVKVMAPALEMPLNEEIPFTMHKLLNSRVYEKMCRALFHMSRDYLPVLQQHTTVIWQPPTMPHNHVIAELLAQWAVLKKTVLIITPHPDILFGAISQMGFRCVKVGPRMDVRFVPQCHAVISGPIDICCDLLKHYAFERVLIDEAHSISQVMSLLAITKGCQKLVLLGDHLLPESFASSPYCIKHKMQVSIMERLIRKGLKPITYTTSDQRVPLNSHILEWANQAVYGNMLHLEDINSKSPVIKGFPWPSQQYRVCVVQIAASMVASQTVQNQASCCEKLTGGIVHSGYTKVEQILWNAPDRRTRNVLCAYYEQMVQKYTPSFHHKRYMGFVSQLVRLSDGSRCFNGDLSILVTGHDQLCSRKLIGAMLQGQRGFIVIGDCFSMARRCKVWSSFMSWATNRRLVLKMGPQKL